MPRPGKERARSVVSEVLAMGTKQTVTGDDGTKYEVQDDGTLRKVEGRNLSIGVRHLG